jgi:hypothetical protein
MAGRTLLCGGGLAVLLALSACSSGGPSRAEFVKQANSVCAQHRETIEAAASQVLAGGSLPDPQQFGRLAQETIIPELTAQFAELDDLEPPDDLADDVMSYVSDGEAVVDKLRQDPSLITDAANFTGLNDKATQVGLSDACNVGPQ